MAYLLVEFDDGGIAVVAKSKLMPRKKQVFWPPVKQQTNFDRYVKDLIEADTGNWRPFVIKRLFHETDDFEKAQKKLKQVQFQSDLASSDLEEGDDIPRKRARKHPPEETETSSIPIWKRDTIFQEKWQESLHQKKLKQVQFQTDLASSDLEEGDDIPKKRARKPPPSFLLVIAERLRLKGLKEVVRARRLSRDLVLIKIDRDNL
ncbi:unnamed protein product [Callosobruchus maculatus]|uniref:Uncharacterized protein n=1 Tax=Callosobruchus maculatus TaxID=64391 RepID=A0A653D0M1_CALMS|nr:unnamed protein product [Callosobruchus maculatus]